MTLELTNKTSAERPIDVFSLKTPSIGIYIAVFLFVISVPLYFITSDYFVLILLPLSLGLAVSIFRDRRKRQEILIYPNEIEVILPNKHLKMTKNEIAYFYLLELGLFHTITIVSSTQPQVILSKSQFKGSYSHFKNYLSENFSSTPSIQPILSKESKYLFFIPSIMVVPATLNLIENGLSEKGITSLVICAVVFVFIITLLITSHKADNLNRINWKKLANPSSKKTRQKHVGYFVLSLATIAVFCITTPLFQSAAIKASGDFLAFCSLLTILFFITFMWIFKFHRVFNRWEIIRLIAFAVMIISTCVTLPL